MSDLGVTATMGLFSFKKKTDMDLPPPPMPEAPELPPMPEPLEDMPEAPEPEEHTFEEHPAFDAPQEEEPAPTHRVSRKGPIFVGVQDYQLLLNSVASIKAKLAETDDSFKKLNDIKTAQDKALEDWHAVLGNVQKKLAYVDDVLFER